MLDVSVAWQSNTSHDARWCVRSLAVVLPVPGGSEATAALSRQHSRYCTAAVTDGRAQSAAASATYDGGRASTDVPGTRGAHHAAVQTGTQLLRQQVHVPALQPRLQPGHGQVSRRFNIYQLVRVGTTTI